MLKSPRAFCRSCNSVQHAFSTRPGTQKSHDPVRMAYASYEATMSTPDQASPLVVMHGLFGSKANWNSLCKVYQQKTEPKRKVMAVDARNHGDSPHTNMHTYEHLAEDIKALLESFKMKKAVLLGHSMGGRAVMYFALKYPNFVEKLIVADISPIGTSPTLRTMPTLFEILVQIQLPTSGTMSTAKANVDLQLSKKIADKGLRSFLLTNLVQDAQGGFKWRVNLPALISNFNKISSFPKTEDLKYVGPVLFVGGGSSDYLQRIDHLQILNLFPHAKFKYIDGAGHWLHSEKPNDFLKITLEFINT